ncbi:MAG: DUF5018 domain-containing protein [Dysgonamonadaceae bacterium]|jgi:hypothetical protein|nr:DUF5018 domain-containing protein [Dysgonamonadaceae bacterium]
MNAKYKIWSLCLIVVVGLTVFSACEDENLNSDADIIMSFTVTGRSGKLFNSSIDGDNITLKVSPYIDAEMELDSAFSHFYLSRGATVSPDPVIAQDFSKDGGVTYTVTSEDKKHTRTYNVKWGISDKLPYGEGFSYAEIGAKKSFVELGYPGQVNDFGLPAIQYGDLQMYHAYCGNYIVLLSLAYVAESTSSPLAVKVVDKDKLNDAGTLNLGSISIARLKMITSDYKGHCVGAVVNGAETELFYWTTPTAAPVSVGKIGVNLAPAADLSNNFQVAGDITDDAWVTALAPRDKQGTHYRVKVSGGRLASEYSTIRTGYSSDDCAGFQMISPMDASDEPAYVVGDTEGTANAANSIHCYINNFGGSTISVMPPLWQNTLQAWWVGTGFSTARTGGRSPVVSALDINGKTYIAVTSGTAWWHSAAVLNDDLATLAHQNLNLAFSINRGWSFGSWIDWYWNEDATEAYLAVWFGRLGLYTYKMTCYE